MGINFKYYEYDLSQNLFYYKYKKLTSLYDHSLILSIAHIFKDPEIFEAFKKTIVSLEVPRCLTDHDYFVLKELESKTRFKFITSCKLKCINIDKLHSYEEQIHNVLMQILDFFIKGVLLNSVDVNRYLKNLTFTSQGTINQKKTIIRILQEPSQLLCSKFEVACYYFIDICLIHNLFHSPTTVDEKKYFASFISRDYFQYFWMWQIYGTRDLVSQTSSIWSSIDVHRDVALVGIFQEAVRDNNELAVQYLWANHISKMADKNEKLCDALQLAFLDVTKINICLYLLFQIKKPKLIESILKCIANEIMKNIIKNNRWHCLFINIFKKLKLYLSSDDIAELLHSIVGFHCLDYPGGITFNILRKNSRSMSVKAKNKVIKNEKKLNNLIKFINDRNNFTLLTQDIKKELKLYFCSSNGINFFTELIKQGKFEFMDNILKSNFEIDDIKEIKLFLNFYYVHRLCQEFIESNQLRRMFLFLDWWSRSLSTEHIQSYKDEIIAIDKSNLKVACQKHQDIVIHSLGDLYMYLFWSFGLQFFLKVQRERNSIEGDQRR
ncbi:UNVERIFIED_CONTAM: hypothetical protein RMT77_011466 [Armadillidium vulgare]